MAALAGEDKNILLAASCKSDPGETVAQNPTVQIAVDYGPQIGRVKTIGPLKPLLRHPFKILEVVLNILISD